MAPRKENMRAGRSARSNVASKGRRCKVCIQCGKEFSPGKEEDDAKLRFSKEETSRFINEEGKFCCGNHRRDQVCNDCFHTAVANDNERRAFRRSMERAVKGIWKKIYLKEGDEVPWSEDEDEDDDEDGDEDDEIPSEDDELPLENVQQQTEKASSSSLSRERTCAYCGKVGNLDRCAKCKSTFYCSPSHQAADYAKHKADCQAPKTLANDTTQPTNTATREEDMRRNASAGSSYVPNNNQQPPSTWLICAHCGIKSDKLSRCSRCKCTWYCSADHQRAHYPNHKLECRLIACKDDAFSQPPAVPTNLFHPHIMANKTVCVMNLKNKEAMRKEHPVISWRELERMHPNVAIGRTLEVRIVSEPSFFPSSCEGRDGEGVERKVELYTHRPPEGLKKGCILRWRNPWFHRFAHGGSGANIEHWDLPNVTVSAA